MNTPNFFCSTDVLDLLLDFDPTMDTMDLTMDVIELPCFLRLTDDGETVTMKVIQRGEIYDHAEDGIEKGRVELDKGTKQVHATASPEFQSTLPALFKVCLALSAFVQGEVPAEEYEDLDPEEAGILLIPEEDGGLTWRVVTGRERPAMQCTTLPFGEVKLCRPYMDELLGNMSLDGMDREELEEAAAAGDSEAMRKLAIAFLNGDGMEQDFGEAAHWLRRLAETGDAEGQYNLALLYAKGCGVSRDFGLAADWMERAAENGDRDAEPMAKAFRQAEQLRIRAEAGEAVAQGRLAEFILRQRGSLDQFGPEEDCREGCAWAKKAAAQGDPEGLYQLGRCYKNGWGVQVDMGAAVRYIQRGVRLGHPGSLRDLGVWYLEGTGVPMDKKKGFQLTLEAAVKGDGQAMHNLSICYQFEHGVGYSMTRAVDWYEASLALIDNPEQARKVEIFRTMPDFGNHEDEAELPPGHETDLAAAWERIRELTGKDGGPSPRPEKPRKPAKDRDLRAEAQLPKGYDEAMNVVLYAMEHGDGFDGEPGTAGGIERELAFVTERAEAGDPEARQMAAAYYLANNEDPALLAKAEAWLQLDGEEKSGTHLGRDVL